MHVRLATLFVVLAAVWAPAAHADATSVVRMLACAPWDEQIGGAVTYAARMSAVPGTKRMRLRIRLFEKTGDGRFERVSVEGLGVWRKSRPGASAFRYEQRVRGLHRGSVYRVVVNYRWIGEDGEPILTARRKSRRCSQDGGLPNMRIAAVDVKPGEVEGTAVYKVKIANRGTAPAEDVRVVLRVDGEVVDEAEAIEVLEPREVRTVTFNGPVCRRQMRVVVDPGDLIAESNEEDNVRDPSCL
jgi:hypothetical protein